MANRTPNPYRFTVERGEAAALRHGIANAAQLLDEADRLDREIAALPTAKRRRELSALAVNCRASARGMLGELLK